MNSVSQRQEGGVRSGHLDNCSIRTSKRQMAPPSEHNITRFVLQNRITRHAFGEGKTNESNWDLSALSDEVIVNCPDVRI